MRVMRLLGMLVLGGLTTAGRADPFYLRYDAEETYPEQDGFTRLGQDPEGLLVRSVEDGLFTIDSRASTSIIDAYLVRSESFDLDPGEELRVNWRMQTLEDSGTPLTTDVNVVLTNADAAFVDLFLGPDFVSDFERVDGSPKHLFQFEPGFHEFSLSSVDMLFYDLFVDGTFAFSGQFLSRAVTGPNLVAFGDAVVGETSLSQWDYVEIAVVPEPFPWFCIIGTCCMTEAQPGAAATRVFLIGFLKLSRATLPRVGAARVRGSG